MHNGKGTIWKVANNTRKIEKVGSMTFCGSQDVWMRKYRLLHTNGDLHKDILRLPAKTPVLTPQDNPPSNFLVKDLMGQALCEVQGLRGESGQEGRKIKWSFAILLDNEPVYLFESPMEKVNIGDIFMLETICCFSEIQIELSALCFIWNPHLVRCTFSHSYVPWATTCLSNRGVYGKPQQLTTTKYTYCVPGSTLSGLGG